MNRTNSTLALSVVPPLAWAAAAGMWTPRGPLTTTQALVILALSLLIGLAAGYLARSRWVMLVAPVIFVVVFEALRAPLDGRPLTGFTCRPTGSSPWL